MNETPAPRGSSAKTRSTVLWFAAILFLGVAAALVALRLWQSDPLPTLEPSQFHAARERWQTKAPTDYDIEVVVRGTQPATYSVQVRDGQAVEALRNGRPLNQRRTFGTWSVPGMFSTMSRDVEAIERRERGEQDPSAPRLTLKAEFDPQHGYPARYRRIQWGSPIEVSWQVTRFEVK